MKIDPVEEVYYRFRLALEHLDTAKRRFNAEDWPGVVESAQLAVKNLAKAIISHFHLPSWTHDPSSELLEISKNISPEIKLYIDRLAEIVSDLAPNMEEQAMEYLLKDLLQEKYMIKVRQKML